MYWNLGRFILFLGRGWGMRGGVVAWWRGDGIGCCCCWGRGLGGFGGGVCNIMGIPEKEIAQIRCCFSAVLTRFTLGNLDRCMYIHDNFLIVGACMHADN